MEPNEMDLKRLQEEVKSLRREMDEMKRLIRSLLQEIVESEQSVEDEFFDFN